MITNEKYSKILNFMTPKAELGHINHLVKMHYFFKIPYCLLLITDQRN